MCYRSSLDFRSQVDIESPQVAQSHPIGVLFIYCQPEIPRHSLAIYKVSAHLGIDQDLGILESARVSVRKLCKFPRRCD